MFELLGVLSGELFVTPGRVVRIESDGHLVVEPPGGAPVAALFLRTTQGPLPRLAVGSRVLLAVDAAGDEAYVLGVTEPYAPPEPTEQPSGHIGTPSQETVRVSGRRITVEAGEELELTCGGGTIRIDKRGKIVVRGTDVVSRARGTNKIKGASVAIN